MLRSNLEVRRESKFTGMLNSPFFIAGIVSVVTLAVFINVLNADFVMWDDDIIIYENPNIRTLNLIKIFSDVDSMMRYNPLTLLGWCLTYHFFKLNPFWYHFPNWLMHGISSILVFQILRKLIFLSYFSREKHNIKKFAITISAGFGAILWSIHPLRTEPVAWCTDRTYCQSTLLLLLSLLFYLRSSEPDIGSKRHYLFFILSVFLYMISLLSYAIGMTFFLVLVAIDIYPLRRLDFNSRLWKSSANRRVLLEKIPFAVIAIFIAVLTVCVRLASAGFWGKPVPLVKFGFIERFMQAIYIWAYYIWRPLYPFNLAPVYTALVSFDPFSPAFIISLLLLISVITLALFLRHRCPLILTLVVCHLFLLIPVLGIFEHPHYPCDRYSIITSLSWSVLLAAVLIRFSDRTLIFNISLIILSIGISFLGFLSFRQTLVWSNSKTLFAHMLEMLGDDPYRHDIYMRLGRVYKIEGDVNESVKYFSRAIKINPGNYVAQNELGKMLIEKNNAQEALTHFDSALRACPEFEEIHINRAKALIMLGKSDKAIENLELFIQRNPNSLEGHYWLSVALDKIGETSRAVNHLKKTLKLAPDWVIPINNLAYILAVNKEPEISDVNEAVVLAKRACELTNYRHPEMLDTLAVAYASAGNFTDAVFYAEKAISLAELSLSEEQLKGLREHLRLFRQRQKVIDKFD